MLATLPAHHPNAVADAVRAHAGTLETVLRASGMSVDEIHELSEAETTSLQRELDAAINQSASHLIAQRWACADVDDLARNAWRADSATAFLKALTTNAVSSLAVNLAVLAVTIPLSFVISPLPLIVVSLGLSLALAWRFGMHAWAAGGAMGKLLDKSRNSRGFERQRFGQAAAPDTVRGAISQEATAEGVRTITRVLADSPRQVSTFLSSVLNIGAGILPIFSAALAPIAALAGPLSNGLMELVSLRISKRDKRYTLATLFGIHVTAEKTITFDVETLEENQTRLKEPKTRRVINTIRRMAGLYRTHFFAEVKREKALGPTPAKRKELFLGGLAMTPVMTGAAGSVASMAGSLSPFVKLAASATVPVLAGTLHVAKRPALAEALSRRKTSGQHAGTNASTTTVPSDKPPVTSLPSSVRPRISYPSRTANARNR